MLKNRVILVVVSVILIVILYNLPGIVVDNDQEGSLEEQDKASVSSGNNMDQNGGDDVHSFEITAGDQAKLAQLKEQMAEGSGMEKVAVADSMASIYLEYSKYDSAARYLEYIVEKEPSSRYMEKTADAYYEAYSFAMDREKASEYGEKARFYYQKILAEQPERFDLRNKVAMTYISSSNPMQGIMMLRQILEEDPENESAIYNLGTLAIQSGQFDRAKGYFEKLVGKNPKNLQAQFYLGLSYFQLGEKEEARKQFELVKSMENDPAVLSTVEGYLQELN